MAPLRRSIWTIGNRRQHVKMNGSGRALVHTHHGHGDEALVNAGINDQMDLFIPHQANLRIIEAASKRLSSPERFSSTSGQKMLATKKSRSPKRRQ
jgi:3-oxoacyl-[acyl-carrier-protein] synthase III